MRRYHLVIGGTIAGVAGVLAFPTQSTHLTVPLATGTASTGTTSATSATTAPSSSGATTNGSSSTSLPASTTPATKSATSSDETFRYGDMALNVTVKGTRITGVKVVSLNETDGRSVSIDDYAVPQLEQQVIDAGSAHINGVSGATFTSQAFVDAIANALGKLGIQA